VKADALLHRIPFIDERFGTVAQIQQPPQATTNRTAATDPAISFRLLLDFSPDTKELSLETDSYATVRIRTLRRGLRSVRREVHFATAAVGYAPDQMSGLQEAGSQGMVHFQLPKKLSISDAKKAGFTVLKRVNKGEYERQ